MQLGDSVTKNVARRNAKMQGKSLTRVAGVAAWLASALVRAPD